VPCFRIRFRVFLSRFWLWLWKYRGCGFDQAGRFRDSGFNAGLWGAWESEDCKWFNVRIDVSTALVTSSYDSIFLFDESFDDLGSEQWTTT
jgi:hypothetical protein